MAITITEKLFVTSPREWRGWLEKHHATKKEIWLIFYKKHTGKPTIAYKDAVDEALCFGWIDGIEKRLDDERCALRFTPRAAKSKWSETNVGRYETLLAAGRVTESGKQAFERKMHVYLSKGNKRTAIEWHLTHKMPKNPTIEQRITWHREHQKYCGCRPIPFSVKKFV